LTTSSNQVITIKTPMAGNPYWRGRRGSRILQFG